MMSFILTGALTIVACCMLWASYCLVFPTAQILLRLLPISRIITAIRIAAGVLSVSSAVIVLSVTVIAFAIVDFFKDTTIYNTYVVLALLPLFFITVTLLYVAEIQASRIICAAIKKFKGGGMTNEENEATTSEGNVAFKKLATEIGIDKIILILFYTPYRKEIGKNKRDDDVTLQDVAAFKQYLLGGYRHWKKVLLGARKVFLNFPGSTSKLWLEGDGFMRKSDFKECCRRVTAWIEINGGDTKFNGSLWFL